MNFIFNNIYFEKILVFLERTLVKSLYNLPLLEFMKIKKQNHREVLSTMALKFPMPNIRKPGPNNQDISFFTKNDAYKTVQCKVYFPRKI